MTLDALEIVEIYFTGIEAKQNQLQAPSNLSPEGRTVWEKGYNSFSLNKYYRSTNRKAILERKKAVYKRFAEMVILAKEGKTLSQIAHIYEIKKQAVHWGLQKMAQIGCIIHLRKTGSRGPRENFVYHAAPDTFINVCECGKSFETKNKNKKTCSEECQKKRMSRLAIQRSGNGKWSEIEKIELVCYHCGITFSRTRKRQSISEYFNCSNTFCSRRCYLEYQQEKKI